MNRSIRSTWVAACVTTFLAPAVAAVQGEDERGQQEVDVLGGPDSPAREVKEADEQPSIYRFDTLQRWASPWFDWKREMKDDHALSLGFSAHWLYQNAGDSLAGMDDDAFGGIYRFQGSWALLGRDTGHTGGLQWRIESRSEVGGWQAPGQLGGAIGTAALDPGFGYSHDFETDLAVFNWTQGFNDNTAGVSVGRLAFDVYQDAFLFQTFSRGFLNRAFLINPTIGTTGIGALGAVAKGFVSDSVWIGAQIYDGNAASGDFDLDTVEEGEWLKSVEIGWTPSLDRRKTDRIQLTYWQKDRRSKPGVPSGSGWAVSASTQWTDELIPFTRFGHSDGGAGVAAETAASVGLEYSPRKDQALSAGVGWADPSKKTTGGGVGDELVLETSYRLQLSPNFSLTPDLQYLNNPAGNPSEDSTWVVGLRAILTF
jgi:porin